MIAVLTHHWAKRDLYREALLLLDRNGSAQSQSPGFISRTSFTSRTDPTMISSLVIWENDEIYNQWKDSPERDDETCPRVARVRLLDTFSRALAGTTL